MKRLNSEYKISIKQVQDNQYIVNNTCIVKDNNV